MVAQLVRERERGQRDRRGKRESSACEPNRMATTINLCSRKCIAKFNIASFYLIYASEYKKIALQYLNLKLARKLFFE